MADDTQQIPTYRPGDTMQLNLNLSDESGVELVRMKFALQADVTKNFTVEAQAEGQQNVVVHSATQITDKLAPGKWFCQYISLHDTKGNRSLISEPGIEFFIEGVETDTEGPTLNNWQWEGNVKHKTFWRRAVEMLHEESKEAQQVESKNVYRRLRDEGWEVPDYALDNLWKQLADRGQIRGPAMLGRDEIARHGNRIITWVNPDILEDTSRFAGQS